MRGYVPDQMPQRDDALNRTSACRAPLVWRVPEGPGTPVGQRSNTRNHAGPGCGAGGRWQGLAGLRDDAPSEARGADGSRAGRRPPACQAARPDSPARQPGPTARCDGARSTRGTTHRRRQSARIPSQQRRQVDAPAARELGCLGAAREAVRQIHRVRLSIKRGQQRMRCDRD